MIIKCYKIEVSEGGKVSYNFKRASDSGYFIGVLLTDDAGKYELGRDYLLDISVLPEPDDAEANPVGYADGSSGK